MRARANSRGGCTLAHKYPFLAQAREALAGRTLGRAELEAAQARVLKAIEGKATRPLDSEEHLATYAAARALLALAGDHYAARKWAAGEATAFSLELEREPPEVLRQVARELLPSLAEADGAYTVSVLDYAQNGRDLAHQAVERGRVWLDSQQVLHLVRRAVETHLLASTPTKALRQAPEELRKAAEELRAKLPQYDVPLPAGGKAGTRASALANPCLQLVRRGVGEGKRWYACMSLAIGLRHDRVPVEQAREVMKEFAANCSKGTHPFTAREALSTLDWVYKRDRPARFSCRTLVSQGVLAEHAEGCPNRLGARRARGEVA